MSYFPKPSLNENDLAIIERGATAAHSIDAGKYVSWHGRTGKAKADILQGATLSSSLFDYDDEGALNALNASIKHFSLELNTTIQTGENKIAYNDSMTQFEVPGKTIIGCVVNVSPLGATSWVLFPNVNLYYQGTNLLIMLKNTHSNPITCDTTMDVIMFYE